MATNLIMKEGRYQEWTVAGKSSGDPVINGKMTGVALTDSDATTNKLTVDLLGVYDLSVKAINDAGNSAVAVGDQIFYVVGDTPLLSKKSSGVFFGFALEVVTTGSTGTINILQVQGPGGGTGDIPDGTIGTTALADKAVTLAKMADMATASLIYRKTAATGAPEVTSLATLKTDLGLTGTNSGDQTITLTGNVTGTGTGTFATTIAPGAVTNAMLASGAGVGALLTAGLGGSVSVTKTSAATGTIVAANATKDRACLVLVVVDEAYAVGTGTLPTVKIGEDDTIEKCMAATVLDDEAAGTVLAFAFTNTATKKIIVTTTAAVGDSTGGCSITVLAIPTT